MKPDEFQKAMFGRRPKNAGTVFDETLKRDGYVYAPGVHDPQHASMVMETRMRRLAAGQPCAFNAGYMSGWSIAAMLGGPWADMGITDRTDIIRCAWRIAAALSPLPLIADAETGFGPTVSMPELVEMYALAGVSVMHLEDQPTDRRCGHLGGKEVLPMDQFIAKLVAALVCIDGFGSDMKVMARTDAYSAANGSPDEAIRRLLAYADLEVPDAVIRDLGLPGKRRRVDLVWCELPTADPRPAEKIAAAVKKHAPHIKLGFNASPNFKVQDWDGPRHASPPARLKSYVDMGFDLIFHTTVSAKSDMYGWVNRLERMADADFRGVIELMNDLRGHPAESGQTLSRAALYQKFEQAVGGDAVMKRYEGSHGFGSGHADSATDTSDK